MGSDLGVGPGNELTEGYVGETQLARGIVIPGPDRRVGRLTQPAAEQTDLGTDSLGDSAALTAGARSMHAESSLAPRRGDVRDASGTFGGLSTNPRSKGSLGGLPDACYAWYAAFMTVMVPFPAADAPGALTGITLSPSLPGPTRTAARRRPTVDPTTVNQAVRAFAAADAVCVFDLETTDKMDGVHKDGPHAGEPYGRVMQLAARRYERRGDRWRLVEELNVLIDDPEVRDCCLAAKAAEVHGISIADLRGPGPNQHLRAVERLVPTAAWKRFLRMADGAPLVGQNILGFDIPFANRELARHGFTARLDDSDAIDTLLVARTLYDLPVGHKQPGYRLRSIADRIGVETDPAIDHNAIGDIDTCWQVWMAMQDDLSDFRSKFLGRKPDQYRGEMGRVA